MTKDAHYFARPGRIGPRDFRERVPELAPLEHKAVAVFGLGCVGAPTTLELVRSGIGTITILDGDWVDPAACSRWPLGLSAAGLGKVESIKTFVEENYPHTKIRAYSRRLGLTREVALRDGSDLEIVSKMTDGASLIFDATAETGVQHFLSDYARQSGLPYVAAGGTVGGWGGEVIRIIPNRTEGCWLCYRLACNDGTIPKPSTSPHGEVQTAGCGNPTFTGASFDLGQVSLTSARVIVSTLCDGQQGCYPWADWDVLSMSFRDEHGTLIVPEFKEYKLNKHALCAQCNH